MQGKTHQHILKWTATKTLFSKPVHQVLFENKDALCRVLFYKIYETVMVWISSLDGILVILVSLAFFILIYESRELFYSTITL